MDDNPITRARKIAGDGKMVSQAALASMLGVSQPAILKAERAGRVSPAMAVTIDKLFGIPRHELRPDLWDAPAEAPAPVTQGEAA